jgi:hypothetical protein
MKLSPETYRELLEFIPHLINDYNSQCDCEICIGAKQVLKRIQVEEEANA